LTECISQVVKIGQTLKYTIHPLLAYYDFTGSERRLTRNCERIRALFRDTIRSRKSGKNKSYDDGDDLLSILLTDPMFVNDEEKMIDELLTIFLAGSKTVQITTNNLLCYLNEYPEVKAKLLTEVDSRINSIGGDTEGPSFNYDLAEEFEYVRLCFYETNRIEGPIISSGEQSFSQDVRLECGVTFPKDCIYFILIDAMHRNPDEW